MMALPLLMPRLLLSTTCAPPRIERLSAAMKLASGCGRRHGSSDIDTVFIIINLACLLRWRCRRRRSAEDGRTTARRPAGGCLPFEVLPELRIGSVAMDSWRLWAARDLAGGGVRVSCGGPAWSNRGNGPASLGLERFANSSKRAGVSDGAFDAFAVDSPACDRGPMLRSDIAAVGVCTFAGLAMPAPGAYEERMSSRYRCGARDGQCKLHAHRRRRDDVKAQPICSPRCWPRAAGAAQGQRPEVGTARR